jgi:phospholipid transport system substrate-binding protein
MTGYPRNLAAAAAILPMLALAPAALAGPPTEQLTQNIQEVVRTLQDPDLKASERANERRQALRTVTDNLFDWSEMAKRSLGRHWEERTGVERAQFVKLLGDLLERSYMISIERYGGERVSILGDSTDGDLAIVRTRVAAGGGQGIPVDYRMLRTGQRWRAYDVVIEGVSLVSNYRTQFDKVIQTSSYEELVKRLTIERVASESSAR